MNKKLLGFIFLLVVIFSFQSLHHAEAATGDLHDWAWSSNFGWISFNSTDPGAGGGPYAVNIDSSGHWSGYAWSQWLGWISFNVADVASHCASVISSPQGNLNSSTGVVTGGAYAMVYGSTSNPSDGCIDLAATGSTGGGVTYDGGTSRFTGYAWGGDTTRQTGPGWIQFNASYTASVGGITGTCTPTTPYQNLAPGTNVTFQAAGTSGTAPYTYSWNGAAYTSTNTFSATYSSTAAGPTVIVKDNTGAVTNPAISCPTVSVLLPLGSGNLLIGRVVSSANLNSYTAKQNTEFALRWNITLADAYSCSTLVTPDPNTANWDAFWKGRALNMVDNGNGTKTWSGNTATDLKAGTTASPVNVGIYNFQVRCTDGVGSSAAQTASAILKVASSTVTEQ